MNTDPAVAPYQGSSTGFEIRSDLTFQTLRTRGGAPLYVEARSGLDPGGETIAEWTARPNNPFHGRLLQHGSEFAFWASDVGWYVIDPADQSITVTDEADSLRRELRLFGIPAAVAALAAGDLSVHASSVDVNGHGIILAGPSMQGKTTLAAAVARAGYRLLSEDTTRCAAAGQAAIFPGPAVVRLRPDVAGSLSMPGTSPGGDAAEDGRVPLIVDPARRGDGSAVPLAAVVFLRPGDGKPALEDAPAEQAVRDLFSLAFRLPTSASRAQAFGAVSDLVSSVPCFDLHRPLTMSSLNEVVELLVERVSAI